MKFILRAIVLLWALSALPAMAVKVQPIAELDVLPEDADEDDLWVIASGHENNIGNSDS